MPALISPSGIELNSVNAIARSNVASGSGTASASRRLISGSAPCSSRPPPGRGRSPRFRAGAPLHEQAHVVARHPARKACKNQREQPFLREPRQEAFTLPMSGGCRAADRMVGHGKGHSICAGGSQQET
jgi:hypothetical protein